MFESLLESYNPYFRMEHRIDDKTMKPIYQFKSLTTGEVFEYNLPSTDIQDYRKVEKIPKSIQDIILDLISHIRDIKIDIIIKNV